LWTAVVGLFLGVFLLCYDRATDGGWEEVGRRAAVAALPLLGISFAAGFLAQVIYSEILESILQSSGFPSANDARLYLARAVGWLIFGGGLGIAIGVVDRSAKRAINAGIGGAVGGGAGGIVFQFVGVNLHLSEALSRLVGFAVIGVLIALATRFIEQVRRDAWLRVVSGGMAGKEFIVYHAVTRIGSSPYNEIYLLKDPAVAKQHAEIVEQGAQRTLVAAHGAAVLVNDAPIQRHVLRNGDRVTIGNTVIAYAERLAAPTART
jgi:hypothetical protein